jgi:hypothetical protein
VTHELGNLIGFRDNERYAVMDEDLEPGVRYLLEAAQFDADPDAPISDAALMQLAKKAVELKFDLDAGSGASNPVDWQKGWDGGWSPGYSPFASAKDAKSQAGNFSEFLVKVSAAEAKGEQGGVFDKLGKALFGAKNGNKGAPKR